MTLLQKRSTSNRSASRSAKKWLGLSALGLGLSLGTQLAPAQAHGARIRYEMQPSIGITAEYDSGDPMAQAQVAVFAPDNPETPWQTGLTDDAGRFRFSPDLSTGQAQAGDWQVQVRQAGHGSIITVPLGTDGKIAPAALSDADPMGQAGAPFSRGQKLLMTALGLWGLLGTGLYFSKQTADQRTRGQPPSPPARVHSGSG